MFPSQTLFSQYAPRPLNDVAVPPFPALEADEDEESQADSRDFDFELPQAEWRSIPPGPPPPDAPVRFVDGSIASRTCGAIVVGERLRPLIAATISAACLELDGRTLKRTAVQTKKLLCLDSTDMDRDAIYRADTTLEPLGVRLIAEDIKEADDFDSMRRSTRGLAMLQMEQAERDVMLEDISTPTLVDGLVERRLRDQAQNVPVIGLVKRQMAQYLPWRLQELAYGLKPGERTPAFVLGTFQHVDIVNCYIRLSEQAGASPSYGLVRMTVPLAYLGHAYHPSDYAAYLSGLAGYIYKLRHRDLAYERSGISIEPIVRVEDHLHALRPDVETLVQKLRGLLTLKEVPVA